MYSGSSLHVLFALSLVLAACGGPSGAPGTEGAGLSVENSEAAAQAQRHREEVKQAVLKNARQALAKGDYKGALSILDRVPSLREDQEIMAMGGTVVEEELRTRPQRHAAQNMESRRSPAAPPSMTNADIKEYAATLLNLNGLLCADVVDIRPLRIKDQYEVTCVAYRGGTGRKAYVLNAADGKAFEQ